MDQEYPYSFKIIFNNQVSQDCDDIELPLPEITHISQAIYDLEEKLQMSPDSIAMGLLRENSQELAAIATFFSAWELQRVEESLHDVLARPGFEYQLKNCS